MTTHLTAYPSDGVQYFLTDNENRVRIALPHTLFVVLSQAAQMLAQGQSVSILYGEELTTQQAADLLQVSRPYFISLETYWLARAHGMLSVTHPWRNLFA